MPVYDLFCEPCDLLFHNAVMPYEEMLEAACPVCSNKLTNVPGRFGFEVKGSKVKERQKLEKRFKKRAKRIEKEFTSEQKQRFERFCDKHGCRKSY